MGGSLELDFIDTHTAGEPTRLVLSGGPELGDGPMAARLERFRQDFDAFRRAICLEPRGSEILVGALLMEPERSDSAFGVIFFNNSGYLGMCGHGAIGVLASLRAVGRLEASELAFDTPAGQVRATVEPDGRIAIRNVPAYRFRADVSIAVDGQRVLGDVAYGGNWFFIAPTPLPIRRKNLEALTDWCRSIKSALVMQRITGAEGAQIDHIELYEPSEAVDARNFVLCPGDDYDRSPCGTGTSAKMACLFADGHLKEGQIWRQESVFGEAFEGWIDVVDGQLRPTIRGRAFVTARGKLVLDPDDPFAWGLPR